MNWNTVCDGCNWPFCVEYIWNFGMPKAALMLMQTAMFKGAEGLKDPSIMNFWPHMLHIPLFINRLSQYYSPISLLNSIAFILNWEYWKFTSWKCVCNKLHKRSFQMSFEDSEFIIFLISEGVTRCNYIHISIIGFRFSYSYIEKIIS